MTRPYARVNIETARELFTMGKHPRADPQLEGAVAIHNMLQRERVAYLADEVGLGKTYVALAVMGMIRHFNPDARVLIIAPKRNIQHKWRNDHLAFVRENWRISDLRVKGAGGGPARPVVMADRLSDLAHEAMIDDQRDFIARLTSFSFALNMPREKLVANLTRALPWVDVAAMPNSGTPGERDFVAQAYNAALPRFDLIIIDEAHNLSGGVRISDSGDVGGQALRNAVLAQVLGHPGVRPLASFADTYRPIAERLLMLSATPVEASFKALWRQVDIVGKSEPQGRPNFDALKSDDDMTAADSARRILVRRINAITVNGKPLTKNLYRRTWYQGGLAVHDEELPRGSARQQLTVALVQKKVADVIGAKYNNTFQMGMLASFESFAQTVLREARAVEDEPGEADGEGPANQSNFDNADQTEDADERVGIDVDVVNRLLTSHVASFKSEMAHPKMDALVDVLAESWDSGSKSLVFVRRIASVVEIKRKLDERYDEWLFARLERDLPPSVWRKIKRLRSRYETDRLGRGRNVSKASTENTDEGGADSFFSWFFRGEGPDAVNFESGASLAKRLDRSAGGAATAFAHHRVATVLGCAPAEALDRVVNAVGQSAERVDSEIRRRSRRYLPANAGRGHQFDAVQFATLELLGEANGAVGASARRLLQAISPLTQLEAGNVTVDPRTQLATETFFTRVRQHGTLAPFFTLSGRGGGVPEAISQEFADTLVRAAARMGNAQIDVYTAFMRAADSMKLPPESPEVTDEALGNLLEALDGQARQSDRSGAFWEFAQLADAATLALIRSKNLPNTLREEFLLRDLPKEVANLLGAQKPTVGMHGGVNARAVRQFRMPGYPYVVVCTDVLQEGEDLHLFCDRVIHYGVAWTPSSMEQRTGRVDRLYSLAERRFGAVDALGRDLQPDEKIQVQVPYLPDTVEVLQTRKVFERMHRFTTLMHEGAGDTSGRLDVAAEITRSDWQPPRALAPLESGFDVRPEDLVGGKRAPAVSASASDNWWSRLLDVVASPENTDLFNQCNVNDDLRAVYAWCPVGDRVQPFTLRLTSRGPLPLVQAITPVGHIGGDGLSLALRNPPDIASRIVLSDSTRDREYDMAIEGDVTFGPPVSDAARIRALLGRITVEADELERVLTGRDLRIEQVSRTMERDSRDV